MLGAPASADLKAKDGLICATIQVEPGFGVILPNFWAKPAVIASSAGTIGLEYESGLRTNEGTFTGAAFGR